jgi:N-methylhydantoinase A/oxoprolinase/acetone carboxylase beta subunit
MSALDKKISVAGGQPARRVHVIACGVLRVDIQAIAERLGIEIAMTFLPGGLHNNPHELRARLQQAIDAASASHACDLIAIGYGVCGRGTVGLRAGDVPLAIPLVHDCIALFLGSDRAYREQFARYPGTYYVSAGWVEEKARPWSSEEQEPAECRNPIAHDFERLVSQYGAEHAVAIRDFLNSWHGHYQRAAFIDTGEESARRARYAGMAQAMAAEFGWKYEEIPGTHDLLTRLLTVRDSTADILIVPSHYVTIYDAVRRHLHAVPVRDGGEPAADPTVIVRDAPPENGAAADPVKRARLGLGIDAGGTYTDIVLYDFDTRTVLQKAKRLTTKWNYALGINAALDQLDSRRFPEVDVVSVSTTLATNAIVEGRGQKVGLLLMPPYGWSDPENFSHDSIALVAGQLEIDGREIVPTDSAQVGRIVRDMLARQGVRAFAVGGYASHVNPNHELQVKAAIRAETDAVVTCAHEIPGGLDYRIRAETAVLNARIIPHLDAFMEELQTTLRRRGLQAPVMVVRSDGSLMSLAAARERPIETILSGPAASVAGAAFLTGVPDAIIVDVGGTTTDTARIRQGTAQTCRKGAKVGRWETFVESLDMRTLGLGGDSRIACIEGRLEIGPQRIAPVAWLAGQHTRTGEALAWMEHRLNHFSASTRGMELFTLTPYAHRRAHRGREGQIVELLQERPRCADELVERLECLAERFLPLDEMEADHIVQRCGLTPTDLLHAAGQLRLWDGEAPRRMCKMYARILGIDCPRFIEQGRDLFVRRLAIELLTTQLADEFAADAPEGSPAAMALIDRALGAKTDGCGVRIALQTPVIGIGAPAHFFLPAAARLLQTEAIIPEHADVANAIGAITSLVRIHRRATIAVDDRGLYRIEGLPGAPTFGEIAAAQDFAIAHLEVIVRELGRLAGTGQSRVEIHVHDHIASLKDGQQLFLERTVEASLSGRPDLMRKPPPSGGRQ